MRLFIYFILMATLVGAGLSACSEKEPDPLPKDPKAPAKRFPAPDKST